MDVLHDMNYLYVFFIVFNNFTGECEYNLL